MAHREIYNWGLRERRKLPRPVLCVGNLTVGGTGKTPFLIRLAQELRLRGHHPAILSRGYKAVPPARKPRIVSNGTQIFGSCAETGDEPRLLARGCPGVPVVIGANRYEAGKLALDAFRLDISLLDDGFQHEALARDADLVLWDARDVSSRMRQLPAGRLREALSALRRASAIILTHAEYLESDAREEQSQNVIAALKRKAPGIPVFEAETEVTGFRPLQSSNSDSPLDLTAYSPPQNLQGKKVILICGLARPDGFEAMIVQTGAEVVEHLAYGDHARYDAGTLQTVAEALKETGAELALTTEKDAVKLESLNAELPPLAAVGIQMRVQEPERWSLFLDSILERAMRKDGMLTET